VGYRFAPAPDGAEQESAEFHSVPDEDASSASDQRPAADLVA
jgi:hypothetical protein